MDLSSDALDLLTEIGVDCSLRYSIQLITSSYHACLRRKATQVAIEDVRKVYELFIDVNRSVQFLKEYHDQLLFSDENMDAKME